MVYFGRLIAAIVLVFSIASPALAQSADRAGPRLEAWADGVRTTEDKRDIRFAALDIDVTVRGGIAETTLTATFANPNPQQLEGQFALYMPPDSVVSGYALDIDGRLIEGVLETQYRAQEAYQRRVTARIDPGLVEVDFTDRFETRVYPILANGSRTIRLRFVTPLDPRTGYVLPLRMSAPVSRFSIDIDGDPVRMQLGTVPVSGDEFEGENVRIDGDLILTPMARPEPMRVSRHRGAERFFEIVDSARPAAADARGPVHIFWDRSVSRADDALAAEAALATAFARARRSSEVTLTLFDSGGVATESVPLGDLAARLAGIHYRGGTSFAGLGDVPVAPRSSCLLFSDGRVTIDSREGFALACPVSTIASGPEIERPWLRDIASRSGGSFVELAGTQSVDAALATLTRPAAEIVAVTDGAGEPIETVRLAAADGEIRLVGPLSDDGIVLLRTSDRSTPRRYVAGRGDGPEFAGPGALWAHHRLSVMAADVSPDVLASLARRYNVATPQASFIVLDTPADYVRSDIAPPQSYPDELRQQYYALYEQRGRELETAQIGRIDAVVAQWRQTVSWWEADYDGRMPARNRDGDGLPMPPPPPISMSPPPPPPPSPPPLFRTVPEESAPVVVTGSRVSGQNMATDDVAEAASESDAAGRGRRGDSAQPGSAARQGTIAVAQWDPDRRYVDALERAGANWEVALDVLITEHGDLPGFWFDVGEWHWQAGRGEEARRAVEAALDAPSRDNQTLMVAAARLGRYGDYDRAIWLLERLAERETDRPQPLRTLALALIDRAGASRDPAQQRADLGRAIELLARAATDVFDVPALGIETTALMEANAALARLRALGGDSDALDERLVRLLDTDLRIVMEWNTPRTDLDLWTKEPSGFDVCYSSRLSPHGGRLSADVTNGFGPEEYMIRRAPNGGYRVEANVFSGDRASPNGPSRMTVRLYRNWGRSSQTSEIMDIEMEGNDRSRQPLATVAMGE